MLTYTPLSSNSGLYLRELPPTTDQSRSRPRLLDQVRAVMRRRHYALRTEETYVQWC